ncbi:MAG TPA: hypothetical protein VGV59_09935 [Pyrinomonadaceae bacterium]|nr:hypothetical protein [Pyrinomonadaceae bacterium]
MTDEKRDFPFNLHEDFAPLKSEPRGYTAEQMTACEKCLRANPPTRLNCLYCGAPLPSNEATEAFRRPELKPLEEHAQGFSVVALSASADASIEEAAALLRREAGALREVLSAGCALPLVRVATCAEAELIARRLGAHGVTAEVLSDEALLGGKTSPTRVRKVEFGEATLDGWAVGQSEPLRMVWEHVVLLVAGRIFQRRAEVEERPGVLKRGVEVADTRETFADEAVLDIFAAQASTEGATHWRIAADGFDYSCLGADKSLLARENFVALGEALRRRATRARFDESYGRLRRHVEAAWPAAERTASGGLRRERPGKFNVEAVTLVTNEAQFTRYARLLYRLELRRRNETREG